MDEMKRLYISLVLHGPTVVHLHPTRIPDNSGAAARRIRSGLAFTVYSNGEYTLMAKQDQVWGDCALTQLLTGFVSEAFAMVCPKTDCTL